MKIYLAGKISDNDWRNGIIKTRGIYPSDESKTTNGDVYTGPYFISCDHGCYHGDSTHGLLDNGFCGSGDSRAIESEMCYKFDVCDDHGGHYGISETKTKNTIPKLCLSWIDDCDVLFAWIETKDSFGTLAEIGYAYGKGKEIWIGYSNKIVMGYADRPTVFSLVHKPAHNNECSTMPIHDTWFIDRLASKVGVSPNPEVLYSLWSHEFKHK